MWQLFFLYIICFTCANGWSIHIVCIGRFGSRQGGTEDAGSVSFLVGESNAGGPGLTLGLTVVLGFDDAEVGAAARVTRVILNAGLCKII